MKKVALLVAVIAVLLLGLPPVLGMATENQVEQRIASYAESDVLDIELETFDRGWFSSQARLRMGLTPEYLATLGAAGVNGGPLAAIAAQRPTVLLRFAHGPIAVLDGVHFGTSKMVARPDDSVADVAALEQQLGVAYLFEFRGSTSFFGSLDYEADIPAIETAMPNEALISFSGATLAGRLDGNLLLAQGWIDSFSLTAPDGTLAITGARATANQTWVSPNIAVGTAEVTLERVSLVDFMGTETLLDARAIAFTSDTQLDDTSTLLGGTVRYTSDSVQLLDYVVAQPVLQIGMQNLELAALEAYNDLMLSAGSGQPDFAQLEATLQRLIAAGPEVAIEPLSFALDGESFEARISAAVDPAQLPPGGAIDFSDPSLWLTVLEVDAVIDIAKPLAAQLAALALQSQLAAEPGLTDSERQYLAEAQAGLMLAQIAGQGLLQDMGAAYRAELKAAKGNITLNEAPLPLGALF